jgi:hypothetical protein
MIDHTAERPTDGNVPFTPKDVNGIFGVSEGQDGIREAAIVPSYYRSRFGFETIRPKPQLIVFTRKT